MLAERPAAPYTLRPQASHFSPRIRRWHQRRPIGLVYWFDSQTVKLPHLKGMSHSGVFGVFMLLCNPRHYRIPCLLQLRVTWYLFVVPAHFPLLSS